MTELSKQKREIEEVIGDHWQGNKWIQRFFELGDMVADWREGDAPEPIMDKLDEIYFDMMKSADPPQEIAEMIMAAAEMAVVIGRIGERYSAGQANASIRAVAMQAAMKGQHA